MRDGRYWFKSQKGTSHRDCHLKGHLEKKLYFAQFLRTNWQSTHLHTTRKAHISQWRLASLGSFRTCSSSSDSWPSRWRALSFLHTRLARSSAAPKAVQPRSTPAKTTATLLVKAAAHAEDLFAQALLQRMNGQVACFDGAQMHTLTHARIFSSSCDSTCPLFLMVTAKNTKFSSIAVNESYNTHQ